MRLNAFIGLILVLTSAWMQFYAAVRETYNGIEQYKEVAADLKEQMEHQRLASTLEREQFLEFRQKVATLMPDVLKTHGMGEAGYPIRNLASVISSSDTEKVRGVIAKTLFESGRRYFQAHDYPKAERVFRQMIRAYSYSPDIAETHFLLAETLFKEGKPEECTTVIQQMIELFPTHELTGFVMIRLGKIFEEQNRAEEAVDIYKTVLRSFPQRDVAEQALASLKGIRL
jgi:TolA-binding protein